MASALRVQFAHGLEGSPQGLKARTLAARFSTCVPAMDTSDFAGCVTQQAQAIEAFRPDVLVGSSFGGALALQLLQTGIFRGPTLLLAQAAGRFGIPLWLPAQVTVTLVHGLHDAVVPITDSRALAATGTPGLIHLLEVDDTHGLAGAVTSGALLEWVVETWQRAQSHPDDPPEVPPCPSTS